MKITKLESMASLCSLVSFSGNYVVKDRDKTRIEMNLNARIGIVIDVKPTQATIFSNNEICIVNTIDPDACFIKIVQQLNNQECE